MADILTEYLKKRGGVETGQQRQQQNSGDYLQNYLNKRGQGTYYKSTGLNQYDVNAMNKAYNRKQQANSFDAYMKELDDKVTSTTSAYEAYKKKMDSLPAFDDPYAGYAVDPVSVENMRTNGSGKADKAELGRLYKEMTEARNAQQEARNYQNYTTKLKSFGGDSEKMFQDYADRIKEIESTYRTQPDKWREASKQVKALEQERDSLKDYEDSLKKSQANADLLDSWSKGHGGTYESYQLAQQNYDELDRRVTQLQNELMVSGGAEQDYSGWATDEMSAAAIANRPAAKGNSKELQAQLEQAIREREQAKTILQYAQAHQADELNKAPDFELKAASGEEKFKAFKQEQAPLRESWEANAGYATDEMSAAAIGDYVPYDPRLYSDYREPDERWTEDEKKRFYYLFDDEKTRQQAYDYAIGIDQKYNRSDAEARDWSTREFATRNFGTGAMASALSVPANLVGGGVDYLRMALENSARGGVYETQYDGWSRWADTTRSAISEKLNESGTISKDVPVLGGKGLGDLYQLMMSMADSSVAVLAGGGAANAVFFGSAAASTTRDALERGISGNRAVALGFAAGAAEVAGETLSIEHLLKQGDIADYLRHGLLREMAKQGGVEASEEVLTSILNMMADAVINGDQAELQQKVYVNVANGMAYDEAVRQASKEWLEDLGTDALGGFLSGGLMSGGRLALQSGAAAVTKYQGDAKGDLELARLTTEGSRSRSLADQYQQRLDKKGSITNLQAARLQAQTSADISAADRPALLRAAEARLRDQSTSKLTSGEYKRMAQDVVDGVLDGKAGKFATALEQNVYEEMRMQIAGETVRTGNWLDDAGLKLTEARNAATKRMKMVETKDGEKAEVKSATMKNGELQLTIEQDGETKPVDLKDLKLDQYQMRALKTLTDTLGDDAAAAYNLMSGTGLQYGRASSIASYATAFGIIRDTFGRSADTEKAEAAALASSLRKGLTDEQVRYAVAIGQKRAKENGTLITREKSVWGTGKVTMDGGTLNDGTVLQGVKNKAQVLRSRQYAAVKAVAKALGIDVVLFESRADKGGSLTGAQGAYQDGVIYLDWNAGMNNIKATSERMLLRTMSHELTHFLQQNASEDYEKLKNYVTSYLAEKMGENYRKLVMEKMANQPGLSYDGAIDEVVADSCETMLRDSQYVQKMIQEDRSFGQKIWDWIKSFFRKIEASDTGAKYMQATIDELREIWDSAMKNAVESRTDTETGTAEMTNAKGETVAVASEETGGMQLSIRTYNEGGKQALHTFLDQQVKKDALTSQEAAEIRSQIETLYQVCKDYDNGKYAPFSAWSNASVVSYDGRPVFSVVKANGEYKLNLDFSLVCKKRRTLDAVFNEMISQGIMDDFDMVQESIAKINDIIRENGFETACGLCFVDSKRYRQGMIADAFVGMYNMQVMSLVKSGAGQKVDYFNYGGDQTKQNTGHGIDTLPDDQLDWTKIDKILQTEKKTTVRWKIANYLKNNPSARRRVMRGDFMSTAGFDAVKAKNPELLSLYNSKKGAGGPKAAQSDVQYLNEIINQNMFNEKSAYEVGGVRIQSFSDYVGRLVFDYVQMVADLSAKKLPAHSYTKEFMFAQQFGLTGIKINMSLVPEVINGGVAAGLDANGNYAWKDGQSFGSTVYDNKGKRLTAAEGFELAKRIQNAEGYSKNCGTIAVGVSDEHIRKMLDDPEIRMIIPYHKSSLNHIVAAMMNIDKYTDYTLQQNTRERKGSKWVNIPKSQEFNFNEALQRLGDAKAAANEYLAWCRENGYKPKFDQFADNANYYKVLEDFSCYDKDGVTNTPLSAVQMKFPVDGDAFGSMSELIEQGLEEDAILQAKQEQAVPEIVKQIQAVLPEFEGTVRERNAKKGKKAQLSAREIIENLSPQEYANSTSKDVASEKVQFSFGGGRAKTANSVKLQMAQNYEREGMSRADIFLKTGWFRGLDRQWRFEIDNSEMKLADTYNPNVKAYELDQLIEHPKLFDAYPELKRVHVLVERLGQNVGGTYYPGQRLIRLNDTVFDDKGLTVSILAHEIQHAIQNIEGFTPGASAEYWENADWGDREWLNRLIRNKEKDLQKAAKELDEALKGTDYDSFQKQQDERIWNEEITEDEAEKEYERFVEKNVPAGGYLYSLIKQAQRDIEQARKLLDAIKSPADKYRNTAGEIEARDVQERLFYNDAERRLRMPNVPDEGVYYARNESRAFSTEDGSKKASTTGGKVQMSARGAVRPELQAEYDEAFAEQNEDWMKQIVAQAAYEAGYTTGAYHGSPVKDITEFRTRSTETKKQTMQLLFGTHFTQSREYAAIYAKKAKNSKGTTRMTAKGDGRVYDVYLDLGKSLDLQTAKNYAPGSEMYQLYEDMPEAIRKRIPPHTFTEADTREGLGSGKFITVAIIEKCLQTMSPKMATDFLVSHGYNSVKYLADYSTAMANNRMTRDPSIIMLDPERIKSGDAVTYDDNGEAIPLSQRFNRKTGDIRYSVRGREYMDAVERGDMDAAQRMVDEAAKAAGYTTLVYRGGGEPHNVFDTNRGAGTTQYGAGTYFTDAYGLAQDWAKERAHSEDDDGFVGKYYINTADMFTDKSVDPSTPQWNNVKAILHDLGVSDKKIRYAENWGFAGIANALQSVGQIEDGRYAAFDWKNAQKVNSILRDAGYKGIIGDFYDSKQYVVFDSALAKSADPVTYDDSGEVIPLDQRFNVDEDDIRYSMRGGTKTDTQLLRDLYDRIEQKVEARAKRNEAGLEKAYQKMVRDKQGVIYELQEEQRKALEKFHELSERYYEKEREVNAALQELDRLVQHSGDRKQIQAQRAKVSAKEEQMAKALERLTQAKGGSEIQEILRQEREIQMQRTQDRIRDSIDRRDLRKRISKLWKELNARVTNPSEKKRIPVELMQQTLDVLEALNMDTSREGSKAGEKLRAKLDSLRTRYEELKNDPDFRKAAVYDAQVAEYLTNMIAQVGDTPINKMSVAQMETVLETLSAMVYTARRALKLKLGEQELEAYKVSEAMTKETRSVEKPKTGFLSTWLNAQLSPERMFNRLGGYSKDSYWGKVYGMLNEGQLKQTRLQMEGSLIFEDLMEKENEKNFRKLLDPKNTVDIGLKDENGEPVLITHGMMISLYMHLQNDQNIRHIAYGGLTIPALQDYYNGKKVRGNERATRVGGALQEIAEINDRLHETEDADEIAELEQQRDEAAIRAMDFVEGLREEIDKQLTDYDRQWIAASKELFDGFSKRELNKTTLDVYGIKRANVENYYPIWVDGDFLNTPFETVAKDLSLENAGFMKERVDSSKPIRLADVTDVTSSQIRKVAQYCGMMPAIRGFNKVWGKTQTGYRDSLQKAVHETFGQAGVKYVENLMADLNGARGGQDSALGEFLNRMRGHMAQASLTMSLRVAMGQTASYPTAAAVVGWGPLMKALAHGGRNNTMISRAGQELIRKWSPLLYYRLKGYSTTELGDIAGMNDKFSRLWKKARWLTGWIQAMDGATVGRLWYAAEYYVQDNNKSLVKGTDAYYEAVAKVFNDIVEKTQPDYTTMQRPDILRSPNALVKQLTMFLTQRLQNFNILYDAAATYSKYKADFKAGRNGVTTEDVRQAGIATRRAVISQLAAAATITAFKFLADAILHSLKNYRDDDDELTKQSVSLEILDMFMDSLAGNVLGGGEIYDLIESKVFGKTYYGIEVSGLATVTDLVDAFSSAFDHALKGNLSWKDADKLARNLATVAGIPYANAKKFVQAGIWYAQDVRNGEWLWESNAGISRSTSQQASRLYRAYTNGDGAKVKQILEEVPEDKQKDVYSAVRKLIREQQKSGELNVYEAMRQMKNYGGSTDQIMAEYIKDLYEAGALPKADAVKYLQEYAGKTKEAATKAVTNVDGKQASGVNYNDIDDMFKLGTMNAEEARKALVGYGIAQDTANMKVEYWSYQQKNPGTAMTTEDRFETYWKKYRPVGMTPSMYDNFYVQWNAVQGTDKDHDGKADRNSKKYERIAIIDSLPLSREQKDALFNMEWKTGLQDAPWNK